jgi:hypothetical protein
MDARRTSSSLNKTTAVVGQRIKVSKCKFLNSERKKSA